MQKKITCAEQPTTSKHHTAVQEQSSIEQHGSASKTPDVEKSGNKKVIKPIR